MKIKHLLTALIVSGAIAGAICAPELQQKVGSIVVGILLFVALPKLLMEDAKSILGDFKIGEKTHYDGFIDNWAHQENHGEKQ